MDLVLRVAQISFRSVISHIKTIKQQVVHTKNKLYKDKKIKQQNLLLLKDIDLTHLKYFKITYQIINIYFLCKFKLLNSTGREIHGSLLNLRSMLN